MFMKVMHARTQTELTEDQERAKERKTSTFVSWEPEYTKDTSPTSRAAAFAATWFYLDEFVKLTSPLGQHALSDHGISCLTPCVSHSHALPVKTRHP
jgi:hypothetical protein